MKETRRHDLNQSHRVLAAITPLCTTADSLFAQHSQFQSSYPRNFFVQ